MDEFQAASDRFLAWFQANGGEFREDLIEIRDLRSSGAGRGIVAIKDIPRDTVLFTIPRALILNVETSGLSKKLPNVFEDNAEVEGFEPLDSWGSLILVMLYEYLQGNASKWKPYFDVLPHTFDTPIFWSQTELEELKGTTLTAERIGKDESDAMLKSRILPVVLENASIFYPDGESHLEEDALLALAHRMGSTIMAYAFDLEPEKEDSEDEEDGWVEDREGRTMLGMVPLADTLNANAAFNVHVNHGENLEVTALRSMISEGTEILNYYGPLPSSELLRRYGYLTPEHQRYDIVEIAWLAVRSELRKLLNIPNQAVVEADTKFDQDELEEYFIIERDSGNPDEEGQLVYSVRLQEVSSELEEQFKAYFKILKKIAPGAFPEKRKREDIYDAVLAEVLASKLSTYPTTLQQDQLLLAQDDLKERHRLALQVRLGEKVLLEEALALVNKNRSDATAENIAKKARN